MPEGVSLPDFSQQKEIQPQSNPYYQAVAENQRIWREAKHGIGRAHEMSRVSEKIEHNMKQVFSDYIDPAYPRIIVARTVLLDTSAAAATFFNYGWDYPESIEPEDHQAYANGINALNGWATNYATRYYLEHTSKTSITKSLRRLYGQVGDALGGKAYAHQTYTSMTEVRKAAEAMGANFNHAVFQALFQHDFTAFNDLIAATPTLAATNLDELALALGEQATKPTKLTPSNLTHFIEIAPNATFASVSPHPADSTFVKSLKRAGDSIITGGEFSVPGIAEVGVGMQVGASVASGLGVALESALQHGDLRTTVLSTGIVGGATIATAATILPYMAIHESVHAYSASDNYVGLIPHQLYRPINGQRDHQQY